MSAPAVALPEAVEAAIRAVVRAERDMQRTPTENTLLAAHRAVDALRLAIAAALAAKREVTLAEVDAAIACLHAINAAGYIDDEDHAADWMPPLHLAFQPWAGGTWRVALDDGRNDPPDMARDTPTEAVTALAAGLDAALDHEARLYAALDADAARAEEADDATG